MSSANTVFSSLVREAAGRLFEEDIYGVRHPFPCTVCSLPVSLWSDDDDGDGDDDDDDDDDDGVHYSVLIYFSPVKNVNTTTCWLWRTKPR